MYSRFSGKQEHVTQLPDHYSGWAFDRTSEKKQERPQKISPAPGPEIAKPTLPPHREAAEPAPEEIIAREEEVVPTPAPVPIEPEAKKSVPSGLFGGIGKAFPFSHGIGFEELFLLGLILLLARDESDRDTVLWLGLLLFCG